MCWDQVGGAGAGVAGNHAPVPAAAAGLAPEVAPGQQPAPPGEPAPSSPPPSPAAEQPPSPPPKKTGIPCPTGWGGNQCAICQSDAACTGQEGGGTGDTGATCSASLTYAPASRLKSLSCDLAQGSPLADLVEPGTLLVQCRTGAPGGGAAAPAGAAAAAVGAPQAGPGQGGAAAALDYASADAATRRRRRHRRRLLLLEPAGGRMCDVSFFTSSPRVMVQCAATDCTMEAGSAAVTCAAVACTCPDTPGCSSCECVCVCVVVVVREPAAWLCVVLTAWLAVGLWGCAQLALRSGCRPWHPACAQG